MTRSLTPATLGLVGLTPLLAVSATLLGGLTIGIAWLVALVLTGVTVSCIRRFIPTRIHLVYLLLIAAAWVSIIDMMMSACCYALRQQLGIYPLLLAMNTTLLFHLQASPLRQPVAISAVSSLKIALAGAALLTATGLLRELAATGGLLTDSRLLAHVGWLDALQPLYLFAGGWRLFETGAGAFIMYGLLLAALAYFAPGSVRAFGSDS